MQSAPPPSRPLQSVLIGWSRCDITPRRWPVLIAGQFYARISEGLADPLGATALAISAGDDHAVFVSCDLIAICDDLRNAVGTKLQGRAAGLDPSKVVLHATHTHSAPEPRVDTHGDAILSEDVGTRLDHVPNSEYLSQVSDTIAGCIVQAWDNRTPGKVAFGQDEVVLGRNRRWVDSGGRSTMCLLDPPEARERFRHIEGYEDHTMNLLATYDLWGTLTGLVINIACPSQESTAEDSSADSQFLVSADFWREARAALTSKTGDHVFVLPQCSAAGDLISPPIFGIEARDRMLALFGQTRRQAVGFRMADAVARILPAIAGTAQTELILRHTVDDVELPMRRITPAEAEEAGRVADADFAAYHEERRRLAADSSRRAGARWYQKLTQLYRHGKWSRAVVERFEQQQRGEALSRTAEVHAIRLGDIAFATNPFELYLDFGIQVKLRSPFIQTFLVQLAGAGTYVPSSRSVAGGGYGALPASTPVGAEGGQVLADHTVRLLVSLSH